jgi:hypothetical protein
VKKNKKRKLSQFPKGSIYASLLGQDQTRSSKLSQSAKDKINKLVILINKGAEGAAAELHSTVAFATQNLEWICQRKPELFTGIARNKFSWPMMCSLHPEDIRENAEFLKKLTLGADTQINVSGRTFSWRVPANIVALNLHELAQSLRRAPMRSWTLRDLRPIGRCGVGISSHGIRGMIHRYDEKYKKQLRALEAWGQRGVGKQLPPLSKQTAGEWARATKELFKIAYPGKFEEHPYLHELRVSVLGRAKGTSGKPGRRGDVRKAMRQAVKQAWHSIAAWTN